MLHQANQLPGLLFNGLAVIKELKLLVQRFQAAEWFLRGLSLLYKIQINGLAGEAGQCIRPLTGIRYAQRRGNDDGLYLIVKRELLPRYGVELIGYQLIISRVDQPDQVIVDHGAVLPHVARF